MTHQQLKQKWWYRLLLLFFSLVVVVSNVWAVGAAYSWMSSPRIICGNGTEVVSPWKITSVTPNHILFKCAPLVWEMQFIPSESNTEMERQTKLIEETLSRTQVVGGITPERIFYTLAGVFALNLIFWAIRRAFFFVAVGEGLSGNSRPSRTAKFFSKFIRGEFPLSRTFWTFGVGVFLLTSLVGRASEHQTGDSTLRMFMILIQLLYFPFVFVSVWRSADRYDGPRIWAVLAKAYFVFLLVAILITQLGALNIEGTTLPEKAQAVRQSSW